MSHNSAKEKRTMNIRFLSSIVHKPGQNKWQQNLQVLQQTMSYMDLLKYLDRYWDHLHEEDGNKAFKVVMPTKS